MARNGIKGGYWLSKLAENQNLNEINSAHFTHLFYASVNVVTSPENQFIFKLDITPTEKRLMKDFTTALRVKQIKSFLSIGGRPDSEIPKPANPLPDIFSSVTNTFEGRHSFIKSSIEAARKCDFVGLELDWEYPNTTSDMENLAMLFREWHDAIIADSESPESNGRAPLLLSAAVYFKPKFLRGNIELEYPIEAIKNYVDLVGLRCYDYHTSRDKSETAAHACLYDFTSDRSTSSSIQSWIDTGLDPGKLVMGLPLFGRTWTLKDPSQSRIGAPAIENVMSYRDIQNFNAEQFRTAHYDESTVSEYSYSGSFWVSYDGKISIPKKIDFAKTKNLGGYFLWAVGSDRDLELSVAASNAWNDEAR